MPPRTLDRILVTSALPYANGPIHLGHVAGAYLPADLYVRYQRLKGRDVVYVCGSDEYGVAILMRAHGEGISPKDIVDEYHPMNAASFERFGMSFDHYGRTTSDVHRETTQAFFRRLSEVGMFKLKREEQLYDPEAGVFLADRFVMGRCPACGYQDAYGDQCERCGTSLSPQELGDPRSVLTDAVPELRDTVHWYIPLGDFQPKLEAWIATHPEWKPNVLGQIRSWFQNGLRDRAITRDVPWGVPVPEDVARQVGVDVEGKVIYVWFDAPIGYVSSTREWAAARGAPDAWKAYWQDEGTKLVHFIGKDNIVFHCLMFPLMLMEHGAYVVPENVPANEFLNLEGAKLSTSRNWAVWLHEALDDFPADLLRYALASTLPEAKDADFSWRDFQARVNGELADVLGNFVHRAMTFATRRFGGVVPPLEDPSQADRDALKTLAGFPSRIGRCYEAFRNREAVFETMNLARLGNKHFNDAKPWETFHENPQACANAVHISLQVCATLSVLLDPVLPYTADRIRSMLRLEGVRSSMPAPVGGGDEGVRSSMSASVGRGSDRSLAGIGWDKAGRPLLEPGCKLGSAEILFAKIEDERIEAQLEKLHGKAVKG